MYWILIVVSLLFLGSNSFAAGEIAAGEIELVLYRGENIVSLQIQAPHDTPFKMLKVTKNNDILPKWILIQDTEILTESNKTKIDFPISIINPPPIAAYAQFSLFFMDDIGRQWSAQIAVRVNDSLPQTDILKQNVPNPFNPETTIEYHLSGIISQNVNLVIYNVLGQKVKTLVDEQQPGGIYKMRWDGKDSFGRQVASGVYIYKLTADNFTATNYMMLVK